jgi:two-component system LytT family response regulator/two-component system response regulator LytT
MPVPAKSVAQVSTLIVDDEKPARDELAYLLKSFPEVSIVAQARNGLEKLVDKKVRLPHIIFATAYDQYALQAFEVSAVDYLLKPFDKARVGRALARARRLIPPCWRISAPPLPPSFS